MTPDSHRDDADRKPAPSDREAGSAASSAIPQLGPELAALESSLGALTPSFSAETSNRMAMEAIRASGFEAGRRQGLNEARGRYRVLVGAGTLLSGTLGVAASVLVMLAIGSGLGSDENRGLANRPDENESTANESARNIEVVSNQDRESRVLTDEDDQGTNGVDSEDERSIWVGLARDDSPKGRSWQFEKLRWTLDYDARIENRAFVESRDGSSESAKPTDYLKERNRILSDANLL